MKCKGLFGSLKRSDRFLSLIYCEGFLLKEAFPASLLGFYFASNYQAKTA